MLIQINTDKHIDGSEATIAHFSGVIKDILSRYEEYITRIEAFLSDENGERNAGADKKCLLEVRKKGADPIVVSVIEVSMHKAVKSAAEKMATLIEKTLEKKRVQS